MRVAPQRAAGPAVERRAAQAGTEDRQILKVGVPVAVFAGVQHSVAAEGRRGRAVGACAEVKDSAAAADGPAGIAQVCAPRFNRQNHAID